MTYNADFACLVCGHAAVNHTEAGRLNCASRSKDAESGECEGHYQLMVQMDEQEAAARDHKARRAAEANEPTR